MKKRISFFCLLIVSLLVLTSFSGTIPDKFKGKWYRTVDCEENLSNTILTIKETTLFDVNDQLGLDCKNVFRGDTLYLYVIAHDAGRGFWGPTYYPPRTNSLFAKCYIVKQGLRIIYTQKDFKDHIKAWGLSTIVYKHE